MEIIEPRPGETVKFLYLGAIQGVVAWSAYALIEFVSSSVVFRLLRPYATFTAWHWQLTALLMVGYLATGLVGGAAMGLLLSFSRRKRPGGMGSLLEGGATLTLLLAFAVNLWFAPAWASGKMAFVGLTLALAAAVLLTMLSTDWAERLGVLTNPWVVSAILLGVGLGFGFLQLQGMGSELGARNTLYWGLLAGALALVVAGSIFIGRWLQPRMVRDRFLMFGPSWAALGLGVLLLAGSFLLGSRTPVEAKAQANATAAGAKPNVIVIVMDTVRADHMSLYGYERETTPNLKKLAADSVVYPEAIAPSDMTLTSHASLFTGLYGTWHGAYCQPPDATHGRMLNANVPTIAEILSAKGYSTLGVAANLYLRADFGLQRGFQSFQIPRPVPVLGADESWYLLRVGMRLALNHVADTAQFDRLFSRGDHINEELYNQLSKRSGAPFFAFLNYMDAHFPYIPPAPYDRMFPGKDRRLNQDDLGLAQSRVMFGATFTSGEYAHLLSQYDGGIAYTDAQIGKLTNWLKEHNLYDNTMIVVTSDHGEQFGEKSLVLHGNSVYQSLVHVALLIKFPKNAQTGVVKEPVSLIDIAPTILTALGEPAEPKMQGRNLLNSPAPEKRPLFSESFQCPVPHPPECFDGGCTSRSVVEWPYKMVTSSAGKRELYDVSLDPTESHDLANTNKDAAAALGTNLKTWAKTMPPRPKQNVKLDGDSVQRLKSLGYVQ